MAAYSKGKQLKRTGRKKKRKDKAVITDKVYKTVVKRDKGRCVVCGSKSGIEVHHVIPRSRGGSGEPNNLATLCKKCHYVKLHGQGDYLTKLKVLLYMIRLGYDFEQEMAALELKRSMLKGSKQEE